MKKTIYQINGPEKKNHRLIIHTINYALVDFIFTNTGGQETVEKEHKD